LINLKHYINQVKVVDRLNVFCDICVHDTHYTAFVLEIWKVGKKNKLGLAIFKLFWFFCSSTKVYFFCLLFLESKFSWFWLMCSTVDYFFPHNLELVDCFIFFSTTLYSYPHNLDKWLNEDSESGSVFIARACAWRTKLAFHLPKKMLCIIFV